MYQLATATDPSAEDLGSPRRQVPRPVRPPQRNGSANDETRASTGLRTARERVIQTVWFEAVGLSIITPLYSGVTGTPAREWFGVLALVSLVVMAWSAAFSTLIDLLDLRLTGRRASDRPLGLRAAHAIALEITATAISCPVICWMTELSWWQALQADMALLVTYAGYGFLFHWWFDRLRPLPAPSSNQEMS